MSNQYQTYYVNQVGSGLQGFQGIRYQRGHGFFGRIISGIAPFFRELFPILGRKALSSGVGLAQDILEGQNFKQAASKRLETVGRDMAGETLDRLKYKIQKGSGFKKKRLSRKLILDSKITYKKRKRNVNRIEKKNRKSDQKKRITKHKKVKRKKGYKKKKINNWWNK